MNWIVSGPPSAPPIPSLSPYFPGCIFERSHLRESTRNFERATSS
jgi:hypothetical protein